MPSLSETQAGFRNAVVAVMPPGIRQILRSPGDPSERMEIYRRHYREGFRRHLRGRYPTLEWLLGTERMIALADETLALVPPRQPSLAEYGGELIATVVEQGECLPPYIADVARLDWRLGCLSVAIAGEPLAIEALQELDPETLGDLRFILQPGLAYVASGWPVDELVHLRHQSSAPEELAFKAGETWLELRGARGRFTMQRLSAGTFAFRAALAGGETLADAAGTAMASAPNFDFATALASLFAEGLVITHSQESHND